jgi:hypothetical protein
VPYHLYNAGTVAPLGAPPYGPGRGGGGTGDGRTGGGDSVRRGRDTYN